MRISSVLVSALLCCISMLCCSSYEKREDSLDPSKEDKTESKVYEKFTRMTYGRAFNDVQETQLEVAKQLGICPMQSRKDTINCIDSIVYIPQFADYYIVDSLTHSIPYLIPQASNLLTLIGQNFKDSLESKNMPLHKIIVTSVTRTEDDLKRLLRRNWNANSESTHRYGTTFDLAWARYEKINEEDLRTVESYELKKVLGEVIFDLKEREKCYAKYEFKQACFHITVR